MFFISWIPCPKPITLKEAPITNAQMLSNPHGFYLDGLSIDKLYPQIMQHSSFKRWSPIIPLPALNMGYTEWLISHKYNVVEMALNNLWDYTLIGSVASFIAVSLGSFTLEEASCHILRIFKQPYGEAKVVRNQGFLSTAMWVRPLNVDPSIPANPPINTSRADILTAISWETLRQHNTPGPFSDFIVR